MLFDVTRFDLAGQTVGTRVLAAIAKAAELGPVSADFRGALFRTNVELEAVEFSQLLLSDARFERDVTLTGCDFATDVDLQRVTGRHFEIERGTFGASFFLQRAHLSSLAIRNTSFAGYASFDELQAEQLALRNCGFTAEARFRSVDVSDSATLRRLVFSGVASLQNSRWRDLYIAGCDFRGSAQFGGSAVSGRISLVQSSFAVCRRLELDARQCTLRGTRFDGPVSILVRSGIVDASLSSFQSGVDLVLSSDAELDLSNATISGPSVISTAGQASPARVKSIAGARLSGVTLRQLDLTECVMASAHAITDLTISGRGQLALAPRDLKVLGQREVIADEVDYRRSLTGRFLIDAWRWTRPGLAAASAPPLQIADVYRALRRAREDARDEPGASDFYYGEMEMRRHAGPRLDRILLTAYWLVSGYGTRISRTLATYIAFVTGVALALQRLGLRHAESFGVALRYIISSTTVITKPETPVALDGVGVYLQFSARIIGPALFALMLFAVRARVRR
jgi:uncharacterized protein YjbI with pentapeptide repeats